MAWWSQNFRANFAKRQKKKKKLSLKYHSPCRGDPSAKLCTEILGQSLILRSSQFPRTPHRSYVTLYSKLYTMALS